MCVQTVLNSPQQGPRLSIVICFEQAVVSFSNKYAP